MSTDPALTVLVPVEKFPSRIQPWLLNALEQVVVRGGAIWIASGQRGDPSYPAKVDELGLADRTLYLELGRLPNVARAALGLLAPGRTGTLTRRGAGKILSSGLTLNGGPARIANRIIKAPAFGLQGVDLLHSHAMVAAYEYLEVAQALGVPLVHTFHGLHPVGVRGLEESKRAVLFRAVAACLVNTEFAKKQLVGLGCPTEKIHILPQGTVLGEFPFSPSEPEVGRPLKVLTVGRLHPDKGHRFAIEAVKILADRGVPVEYRIVGRGPDREELERVVRDSGAADRITLVGSVDDAELLQEYRDTDVFILPSVRDKTGHHEETQGVVVQEAQASGAIVVATRTGGIPECVDHGVSAFLVEDRNAVEIADALQHIAERPEQWAEWQRLGRKWVEDRFDIELIGERLWALYHDVVASRPSGRG